jgi:hypothetical protein
VIRQEAAYMSVLATITFMTGIVLGMRFKFLVLIPATVFAVVAIVAVGVAHADDTSSMVVAMLIATICLQAGYLGGLFGRYAAVVMRAARIRKAHPQARSAISGAH